jgi:hypothetical protein
VPSTSTIIASRLRSASLRHTGLACDALRVHPTPISISKIENNDGESMSAATSARRSGTVMLIRVSATANDNKFYELSKIITLALQNDIKCPDAPGVQRVLMVLIGCEKHFSRCSIGIHRDGRLRACRFGSGYRRPGPTRAVPAMVPRRLLGPGVGWQPGRVPLSRRWSRLSRRLQQWPWRLRSRRWPWRLWSRRWPWWPPLNRHSRAGRLR